MHVSAISVDLPWLFQTDSTVFRNFVFHTSDFLNFVPDDSRVCKIFSKSSRLRMDRTVLPHCSEQFLSVQPRSFPGYLLPWSGEGRNCPQFLQKDWHFNFSGEYGNELHSLHWIRHTLQRRRTSEIKIAFEKSPTSASTFEQNHKKWRCWN